MAYGPPRPGDERVSGALPVKEAEALCREAAEAVTRMGHGNTIRYYVAKYGKGCAVFKTVK